MNREEKQKLKAEKKQQKAKEKQARKEVRSVYKETKGNKGNKGNNKRKPPDENRRGFQNGAGSSDHAPALKCRRQIVWRNADAVGG